MARIRTIKPAFWKHEDLSELPEATHMLAAALVNYSDDEGYFNANEKLIHAECCPLREPSVSIHESINLLVSAGYLELFNGTDGKRYGRVVKFSEHQTISRATKSKIKGLCSERISPHEQLREPSGLEEEGNKEGNIGAKAPSSASADCETEDPNVSRAAIAEALNEYLDAIGGTDLPKPRSTPRQRKLIATRLKSHGPEDWRLMCAKIRGSPFLQGKAGREGWTGATLDWICTLKNFEKTLDGNYDNLGKSKSDSQYGDFLGRGEAAGNVDDVRQGSDSPQDGDDAGGEPFPHLRLAAGR